MTTECSKERALRAEGEALQAKVEAAQAKIAALEAELRRGRRQRCPCDGRSRSLTLSRQAVARDRVSLAVGRCLRRRRSSRHGRCPWRCARRWEPLEDGAAHEPVQGVLTRVRTESGLYLR